MRVRHLLRHLQEADPDAVVLYLPQYGEMTDAEEVLNVAVIAEPWACERHYAAEGKTTDVHHPAEHGLSIGWQAATDRQWRERVVILSADSGAGTSEAGG
ncbi:hypothetical protein BC1002_0414 [Paraburkholderia atlantica]|uniref:Uncharacterized protein n=1 Tax=Paraburkholderia atlantica TaxID=2654982 RepID=D5WBI9_PARAM|nr:hypothetical protein [Paraburkholderia atlantica]ADG14518.1 hypothetical protein BC1002_0414 [Paraburkholderia atlantica]